MKKLISILMLVLALGGCKLFSGPKSYFLSNMNYNVPQGTPAFQQGWRDGCENGLYARGNALYRSKYNGYQYTIELMDNPEYKFGYGRAYGYCFTLNTAGAHDGGFDQFIYARGVPFDMGRASIDGTMNYETGTWSNPIHVKNKGVDSIFDSIQSPKGFSAFGSHPLYGTPNDKQIFGW
jgi:hypothetical protein